MQSSGVLAASSDLAVVDLGFYAARVVLSLTSGSAYVTLASSAGTTDTGLYFGSTAAAPLSDQCSASEFVEPLG